MATDSGIDPRYAAQFQRGYDPARHAPPAPSRPAGPVRIEGGPPPAAQRVPDPPPIVERAPAEPVEPRVEKPEPEADTLPDVRPRAEWALLGAGIVLLVLASTLFFHSATDRVAQLQGVTPGLADQLHYFAVVSLPGPLLIGGVLAICLWIVLRALAPRRAS